jgi:BA14K-like protein
MLAKWTGCASSMAHGDLSHARSPGRYRDALFCQARQKEVSMLRLKHMGAVAIATLIATVIVVDAADARRGGGGGGGARASGLGGGARVANVGSVARVANPGRRADIGRPGRPGFRPSWGWGGGWNGPGWGWGGAAVGAAAVGTGLAYASSNYCDPYYGPCNGPYGSYGSYSSYGTYAPPTYGANYGSIVPASPSYGSYANGTFGALGATRATTYATSYAAPPDAIAYCGQRFRSYDPASQTYLSSSGQRVPCP